MSHPASRNNTDKSDYSAWLRACLLVLLLVLAQLGAVGHALGHLKVGAGVGAVAGDDGGQGTTPDSFCEWCAAYAQSGNAVPAPPALPPLAVAFAASEFFTPAASIRSFPFVAYLSQAPPQLS